MTAPSGYITICAADAALIRAALVAGIKHRGGSLEQVDEPGLTPDIREFEDKLRTAVKVLDRAGGEAPTTGRLGQLEAEVVAGWKHYNGPDSGDDPDYTEHRRLNGIEGQIAEAPIETPADMAVKMRRVFDLIEDANLTPWNYASLVSVKDAAERWASAGMVPTTSITMLAEVLERLTIQELEVDDLEVARPKDDPVWDAQVKTYSKTNSEALYAVQEAIMAMPAETLDEAMLQLWLVGGQIDLANSSALTEDQLDRTTRELNRTVDSIKAVLQRELSFTLPPRTAERYGGGRRQFHQSEAA